MSNFKPQAIYRSEESIQNYRYSNSRKDYIEKRFPTFVQLKKELRTMLEESVDNIVNVYRSRRGEWGEWYEEYTLSDGKIICTKKTWL